MQGTSLTKQERECKLYDEFDKFTYKKGDSLHEYYLRFTLLLNDMNIYKMSLEQFQVNTKFLNTLPAEWSKFVTDVKLVKDLHTTNVDQIHAYLQQHERHANEVRLMHELNQQSEFSQLDSGLTILIFKHGDDLIDAINHVMSILSAVVTSRFPTTNNQLRNSSNPRNAAWYKEKAMLVEAQDAGQILDEEQLAFLADPGDLDTYDSDCDDLANAQAVLMANISSYGSDVISEVPNPEIYLNDMDNQSVHALQDFEQSPVMDLTDNEIYSDSNIIPYS
ncbi:hypothetical protein Tco_0728666 [Tanacetum coccineum]|uniref:Integrase, catalytic region, zinc finger, CCHC-type, peptidase aspartic, catalytic n=1 Tax=Tanacetum coccineum TaxID=301880 RepID=A0ABQ4YMN5_9ASTR